MNLKIEEFIVLLIILKLIVPIIFMFKKKYETYVGHSLNRKMNVAKAAVPVSLQSTNEF